MTTTTATAVSKVPTEATSFPFPWPEDKAVGHQSGRQARSAQCQGSDAGFRGFGGQAIDQRQQRKRKSTTRPSLAVLSSWVSWVQLSKALSLLPTVDIAIVPGILVVAGIQRSRAGRQSASSWV